MRPAPPRRESRHADHRRLIEAHMLAHDELAGRRRVVDVPHLRTLYEGMDATTLAAALDRPETTPLDLGARHALLDQLILALDTVYVHRDLKRTKHAVDPVAALRRLKRTCGDLPALTFHLAIMRIFKGLRDQHTAYILPRPYRNMVAVLPFLLGACIDDRDLGDVEAARDYVWGASRDDPCVIVTNLLDGFAHPHFQPGVEILTWNGLPIAKAVRLAGQSEQASNPASEIALGVRLLTVRWLGGSLPPDEYFVTVGYIDPQSADGPDTVREIRFRWAVIEKPDHIDAPIQALWGLTERYMPDAPPGAAGGAGDADDAPLAKGPAPRADKPGLTMPQASQPHVSIEARSLVETMAREGIFPHRADQGEGPETTAPRDRRARVYRTPVALENDSSGALRASTVTVAGPDGDHRFGLLRVVYFGKWALTFRDAFAQALKKLPPEGLAIDIRSNPGGEIEAAEIVLKTMTDRRIEPLPFQFLASPVTEALTRQDKVFQKAGMDGWLDRVTPAVDIGSQFSRLGTMTCATKANAAERVYFGPVVLLTDAITYSSGDIFAASFQDHEIGRIIGVDGTTGGGGANVWTHASVVRHAHPRPEALGIAPLPGGVEMRLSVRRCARVGRRAGMPIEEEGVIPDDIHHVTRRDLLHDDVDLMKRIADELHRMRGVPS